MARNINLTLSTDEIDLIRFALSLDLSLNSGLDELPRLAEHKKQVEVLYAKLRDAYMALL